MAKYLISIAVDQVDIYDDELGDLSLDGPYAVYWGAQDGVAHARAFITADTAMRAVKSMVARLRVLAPGVVPLYVIEDWVSATDIAERCGVSRETVRLWATGARGHGFPRPHAVVSHNQRIWAWSAVNQWLRTHRGLGDAHEALSPSEAVRANEYLTCVAVAGSPFVPVQGGEDQRWSLQRVEPTLGSGREGVLRTRNPRWKVVDRQAVTPTPS